MSKLFEGIKEPRYRAAFRMTLPEELSLTPEKARSILEYKLSRHLAEAIVKEKLSFTKAILPRTTEHDSISEYRVEAYVFTPDELERFVSNIRADECGKY